MRAVEDGTGTVDAAFRTMMDECLACRACEAACPSGVPFGRMIEGARAQAEPDRPVVQRTARRLGLSWTLSRPRAVRALGLGAALANAVGVRRVLPPGLAAVLPPARLRDTVRPLARSSGAGERAALLSGCVMDVAYRNVHRATMRLLTQNGYRVTPTRSGGCCGALAAHYGQPEAARRMARERIAEIADAQLVVVNAAGCSGHMKAYGELLADDPDWAAAARRVAARVQDLLELDLDVRERHLGPIAVHDACHHLHAQGIEPRPLLRAAGAETVDLGDDGRCCGAAGLYGLLEPEQAEELRRAKSEAIADTGAPIVAVANPGCAMQIQAGLAEIGTSVRVAHPAQLIS
jgi:glycolate oxidase iron-sulfur subunit